MCVCVCVCVYFYFRLGIKAGESHDTESLTCMVTAPNALQLPKYGTLCHNISGKLIVNLILMCGCTPPYFTKAENFATSCLLPCKRNLFFSSNGVYS